MKKAVIAVMVVIMTLTAAFMVSGCTNEAMQIQIDSLVDRIENLENKNNVFWTDRAEYAETETMTVYFKDIAVLEISLNLDTTYYNMAFSDTGNHFSVNSSIYLKSLVAVMYAETILFNSYLTCDDGSYLRANDINSSILYKDVKTNINGPYEGNVQLSKDVEYDFVICVPGTPFELARFKNVSVQID